MARQRRGGFKTPELRGTLGTLLRTTREVLERGAREGKSRVEEALAGRRRSDALAELGEIVLDLIRRGEIDVDELPEVRDVVAHLDELDAGSADDAEPVARAPSRRRFDARSSGAEEDGTVSAKTWAPPTRKKPEPTNVWRPQTTKDASRPPDEVTSRQRPPVRRADTIPGRKQPSRGGGGITFDDDDSDLADYMHPDDVPPKPSENKDKKPPEGDS